jgi:hypothetical protein
MGGVYEAIDTRLRNHVAVKQILLPDGAAISAFEQEARLLASLRHPALPVVIDHFTDGHDHFLVMQYIEGEDLAGLLEHQGHPCSADDVIGWARAILEALIYLHGRTPPVVHRDIKPANLRRTLQGHIVLLDFGLAKGRRADDTHLAGADSVYGYTRWYAPPEQILGFGTDARSDLYSLGATLFHLITGRPPADAAERLRSVDRGEPDPFDPLVGQPLPPHLPLIDALRRAMALAPAERFASAREMLAAIGDAPTQPLAPKRHRRRDPTSRRVDAAVPSQVEIGRPVDLLLQVRFPDSPLLGLEDWPARRRPAEIEQRSEAVQLHYPEERATGRLLPARLRVKLTAPDFVVAGDAERTIDVPPDDYSPRVSFLLTARRPGTCRINVEVYTGENVYMGSVPIETEGVGTAVAEPDIRVANLVLEILAGRTDDVRRLAEAGASVPSYDRIAAVLPPHVVEAARMRDAPAAIERGATQEQHRWIRRTVLLAPVLFAAFAAGWLMLRSPYGRPHPEPSPITGASSSIPREGGAPPSAALRLETPPTPAEDLRGVVALKMVADTAKSTADTVGIHATSLQTYGEGRALLAEGNRQLGESQLPEAARAFRLARQLFDQAAQEGRIAKEAADREAKTPGVAGSSSNSFLRTTSSIPAAVSERTQAVDSDEGAIRAVLQRYANAFSQNDADGVAAVTTQQAETLRRGFALLISQRVQLTNVVVTIESPTRARVQSMFIHDLQPRAGKPLTVRTQMTFTLEKGLRGWIIVERRPS